MMKTRITLLILGAAALPFLFEAVLMLVAEPFYGDDPTWSIVQTMGMTSGFAAGILCIIGLPIKMRHRIAVALAYWPVMTALLFFWGFVFTGWAFDRWL